MAADMPDFSPKATPMSSTARMSAEPWLTIVGIGEDGRAGLSPAARAALEAAELVVGGERHLALAAPFPGRALTWPSPLKEAFPEILAHRGRPVLILASGDPFNYGIGAQLAALVPADELLCLPQPSSFSLAAARLGWSLPDVATISLHGRALAGMVPYLQPGARLIVLTWDGTTPGKVAALLTERGFGASRLTVLEAMGGPRERRLATTAQGFDLAGIGPLNTLAVEVVAGPEARVVTLVPGRDDAWFDNDGQLTKSEIRAVTLAALAPRAGEVLWDIGAGAGSIAIEWCLAHPRNRAFAVEERPDRAARAAANADRFGAIAVTVVEGRAPEGLADLPRPEAVFIGGGLTDAGVFEAAWAALPAGGRLVANAVTLESEQRLAALFAAHGGQLRRLSVARAEPVGGFHGWRAAMPVSHWVVDKP